MLVHCLRRRSNIKTTLGHYFMLPGYGQTVYGIQCAPHSSHHPHEVLLAQFSLSVHKGGLKPHLFHLIFYNSLHFGGQSANTRRSSKVAQVLGQRRRQWPTLSQHQANILLFV